LGVSLVERGESFYQDLMKKTVDFLNSKNLLEEDDGRKVMFAKGIKVTKQRD
jgi:arginyl-tRNA synthetase